MKKVLITHPILDSGINLLKDSGFEVVVSDKKGFNLNSKDLLKEIKKHSPDALISFLTDEVSELVLSTPSNIKIISNYAVGYNNIDIESAKKAGIAVANTPIDGYPVAEFTASLIVSLTRKIVEANQFVSNGKYKGWNPELFVGCGLRGKTLGIVGTGRIGFNTAMIMNKGFGMNIIYSDINSNEILEKDCGAKKVELDEVFSNGDIVSIHVPLLDSTHHLVNEQKLSLMKKSAFLINTARGPIVEESALVKALVEGKIAGAGLDVFEFEPKVSRKLQKMDNVILTPHIASATIEAREEMSSIVAQNIVDFFAGNKPKGFVV